MDEADEVPSVLDALCAPDDVAQWSAEVTPGSLTVNLLAAMDPRSMSYQGLLDSVVAMEKAIGWLQARQYAMIAELATRPAPTLSPVLAKRTDGKDYLREELGCALLVSFNNAATRLATARELTTRLPDTLALLERGAISPAHARALAEAVASFDDPTTAEIEKRVLPRAPGQTLTGFKRSLDRAVQAADPASAEKRRNRAEADRCVRFRPDRDGMSTGWALLPAEGAATIDTLLDAMARQMLLDDPGDPRTLQQRRADALVQLAADHLTGSAGRAGHGGCAGRRLPTSHGLAPRVQVTVALSTLLGLDEQPGELDSFGPVPAQVARRIAADPTGTWYRLVTDEAGTLVDLGTVRYRPPKDLADYVIARDGTCRYPGCNRPACRCEIDHQQPFSDGGTTCRTNTQCLCCRHHHLKHEAGWHVTGDPDGDLSWTSPAGRSYTTSPAEYPIDHTVRRPVSCDDPDPPPF